MSPTGYDEIERLSRVFEKAPYPIFICDPRGELVFANGAATEIYSNLHKSPSIQQWTSIARLREAETGDLLPTDRYPIARALRGEIVSGLVVDVQNLSTKRNYRISIDSHPVYASDGKLIGAVSVHRLIKEN
jgi:PAS domain-containing protein